MAYKLIIHHNRHREMLHRLIEAAPLGALVSIMTSVRTTDQNSKMWAMLGELALQQPDGRKHTPEVWKCIFMQGLGHKVRFEIGLDGEPFPVGFRSSRLTKRQMSDLIELIYWYAGQHGVIFSDDEALTEDDDALLRLSQVMTAQRYMQHVKQLDCAICGKPGPSDAHHTIHHRYSTLKTSDWSVIPLCKAHHQEGPQAIHNGKERWLERYGPDHTFIPQTRRLIMQEMNRWQTTQ